jgi:geranylgeranyl diphosphate synthase type I
VLNNRDHNLPREVAMSGLRSADLADDRLLADDALLVASPADDVLRSVFRRETERWGDVDPFLARLVGDLADFALHGGKRLRPAFVYWGFAAVDGDPDDLRVHELGAAMELLHAFALLHDDVMDGAETRRGRAAAHKGLMAEHHAAGWNGESRRFGEGIAILMGDLAFVYADRLVSELPTEVRRVWDELRVELTMGQYLDVIGAARADHDLERSERIALYKSGRYSVERPLHLGAALGGQLLSLGPHLSQFGAPLGEAFQLRDDLLGAIGDEAVTGKPVGDDLREGKPTVLLAYAHVLATASQRRCLDRVGQHDLRAEDVAEIQDVLVTCGAVDAVEGAIAVRVHAARAALNVAPITDQARVALVALADMLAWRDQ